jgi:hypothetical protein
MSDIIDFRHDNLADVPSFFTGASASNLVPSVFPVAIDGRPYMIDQKSKQFVRGFEPRIRDSVDQGVEPGEATINPQGLWRRNQTSWHFGAGQVYGDVDSAPYRFYKSKGVNPWTKGRLTLLNATKLSLSSAATSQHMVVQDGRVYASVNGDVKYTTNPFTSSPTWTDCTGEPGGSCQAMATDGNDIYLAFPSDGVRRIDTSAAVGTISGTKYVNSNDNYYMLGFAKNFMWGAYDHKLATISSGGSKTDHIIPADTAFTWIGVATGQNAVYATGYSGKKSLIYKVTIKADGTLDAGVVALELPTGEVVTAISGYLGFILLGTNKGVRFCSTDNDSNLVAGSLIRTSGSVYKFASNDRFVYFTWSNYDNVSSGLGRMDLSVFTSANTPAYATDLMYTSTADVKNVVMFDDSDGVTRPVFSISGVGIVVEDSSTIVSSGNIETGVFRWGIMDPKFVVKVDARTTPLVGSITFYTSLDDNAYVENGTSSTALKTQHTFEGSETKMIEAAFKVVLTKDASNGLSPTLTRIVARAYATPTRSEYFKVPLLLHHKVDMWGRTYHFDVLAERAELRELVQNPRVIKFQEGNEIISVIVEDMEWQAEDGHDREWEWDGTAIITMRSIQE